MPDLDPTGHPGNAPGKVTRTFRGWRLADGVVVAQPPPGAEPEAPQQVTVDSVPSGAVDIRRELTVRAADADIGRVQGLLVDPGGHRVTHVLLQAGHMRGRKEVAIPVGAVTKIGTMTIHLSLWRGQRQGSPGVMMATLSARPQLLTRTPYPGASSASDGAALQGRPVRGAPCGRVEDDEYAAFVRRILRACSRRVGDGDVEAVALMPGLAEGIDTAIAQAVNGLRACGYSWAEIGSRPCITRQAAQQRWGTA